MFDSETYQTLMLGINNPPKSSIIDAVHAAGGECGEPEKGISNVVDAKRGTETRRTRWIIPVWNQGECGMVGPAEYILLCCSVEVVMIR